MVEALRRAPSGPARAGFTATKKIGGAVQRNRAKRRLRAAADALLPGLGLPGCDYVFIARQAAIDAPWPGLLDDVGKALIRLRAALDGDTRSPRRARPNPGRMRKDEQG